MSTTEKPLEKGPAPQTVQLTQLTSIRFFAALHIFIFHLYEAHRMSKGQENGIALDVFDALPMPLLIWLQHGYFSTSLFFLISGFILSYLYILPDGKMSLGKRTFWIARFSRVYPLHILILVLGSLIALGVVIVAEVPNVFDLVVSGILCATLLQAWFPPYALSWNFPTWALSTVAFYYLAFPLLVAVLRRSSHRGQWVLLCLMPFLSLLPTFAFLYAFPDGGEPLSFWNEFVMRLPLFWIPHFFMGMLLARLFSINRFDLAWRNSRPQLVSWGDAAFAIWIFLAITDWKTPPFVLRHGLLAPLYLVMIYQLAQGQGLLARALLAPGLRHLGDASFSIFVLQMPVGIIAVLIAGAAKVPSFATVPLVVAIVVTVSLLSTNYFEKPISKWLRAKV